MKKFSRLFLLFIFVLGCFAAADAQQIQLPRESQSAQVAQTIGDAVVKIVYARPNVKGREIWGKLVPYNEVWRTGANENTTFETSENVRVNGQDLPAGKYGLHTIPNKDEWIIIFNRVNDAWGSFTYDAKQDALRVKVKPQVQTEMHENLTFAFENVKPTTADAVLTWEKLRVPFTIDAGDVNARVLSKARKAISNLKADDAQANVQARMTAANFVISNKLTDNYAEAMTWIDQSLKMRESFSTLGAKARLSAAMNNYKDAGIYGDKAVAAAKTAQQPVNAEALANFEKDLASWKSKN